MSKQAIEELFEWKNKSNTEIYFCNTSAIQIVHYLIFPMNYRADDIALLLVFSVGDVVIVKQSVASVTPHNSAAPSQKLKLGLMVWE